MNFHIFTVYITLKQNVKSNIAGCLKTQFAFKYRFKRNTSSGAIRACKGDE